VTPAEKKCIVNVSRKYIATSLRVSNRFSELQETIAATQVETAVAQRKAAEAAAAALRQEVASLK